MNPYFDHEKLHVYQESLAFIRWMMPLPESLDALSSAQSDHEAGRDAFHRVPSCCFQTQGERWDAVERVPTNFMGCLSMTLHVFLAVLWMISCPNLRAQSGGPPVISRSAHNQIAGV